MIELSFTVNTQVLARTDSNTLASNSRQVHQCSFDFSSEWDGMEKIATFKKNGIVYNVMLDNDACIVPNEVLIDEKYSVFAVAVYGTNGTKTITSTAVIIPVQGGSNTDGVETEITPSMFEQIMGKILEIEQGEVSPEAVADAVNDYMEQHPIDALTEQECINLIAAYFLDHKNELKGDPGEPGAAGVTPIISATAEVGATVGIPSVTVTKSGTTEAPNFNFNFQNLKGEQGNPGSDGVTPIITANATVDNTSGNPSVAVTKSGTDASPVFNFAFTGLKGEAGQGCGGSSSNFDKFCDNIDVDYAFDSATNANYTVFRIYKNKLDGTKQYPFVRYKNMKSSLELAEEEGWFLTITGGLFDNTGSSPVHAPDGVVIENGEVLNNEVNVLHAGSYPLLIDSDGNLSYAQPDETGLDIMNNYNNIVSAVGGWQPIIVNYQPLGQLAPILQWSQNAQRMIIGQFGNGDYAVITCEGRNFDHSDGWTVPEAITICQKLGLKFAYNLDGGGSVESVLGVKQFNTIYENAKGRKLSTFIVFTGSTTFNPEIGTTLSSISATKTDKEYTVGDTLDISDLVVIANYSDGTHANVTSSATINTSSVDMTTAGTYSISVSYTQGGVTKTASISIVVSAPTVKTLTSISATKTQTSYGIGDTLSTSDIVVTAHYSDSTSANVTSSATIDTSDVDMSAQGTYLIVVSYTEDGITETTSISISVGEIVTDYNFLRGYTIGPNSEGTAMQAVSVNRRLTALTQTSNAMPIKVSNSSTRLGYMIPVPTNATAVTVTASSGYIPAIRLVTSGLADDYDPGWGSENVVMASFMPNRFQYLGVNVKNSGDTTIPTNVDTSSWNIRFTYAENRDYFVQTSYVTKEKTDGSMAVQSILATRATILSKVQNAAEVKGYTDTTKAKSATLGYLIPVPSAATSVTAYLPSDNAQSYRYIAGFSFWNIQNGVLKPAYNPGWGSETTTSATFTAGDYQYMCVNIKNSADSEISANAPINDWTVTFE